MKSKIKKIKMSITLILIIEAIVIATLVGLAFKWSNLIYLNVIVGYILFALHILVFFIRRKLIISKFHDSIKKGLIFKSYIEKREYIHNFLLLYTSFFILVFVTVATIVFIFIKEDENNISLDLLSLISAAIVITSPFLSSFYKKILNIAATEGDMKKDALKKDIKYVLLNNKSLNSAINDIELNIKTIKLLKEEANSKSDKIVKRIENRIDNINEQITLFELYLVFEAVIKNIDSNKQVKKLKKTLLNSKEIDHVFTILNKYK